MPPAAEATDPVDSLLPLDDPAPAPPPAVDARPWRVLVVDDDEDVHIATEIAMRDVLVEGHPIRFLHAHSGAEALAAIAADEGIAAVLLDVVMETPDAGLRLVRQVREELGRRALRIILRTGQPGYAPEIETLRACDINDYRTKSELTRVRLFSSLTVAIRSFAQLSEVMRQRDELARAHALLHEARAAEQAEAGRRAAAEAALQRANETMEQCVVQRTQALSLAVDELDEFNRMVSHDLSGPLHGLAGLSGLIRSEMERGDSAKLRRWLVMMEQQTRRLAELVGDLLALARVSRGELRREPVALAGVVQDALQMLALAHGGEALAAVEVGELPELSVDAGLMRQVFVNLLSNALKFTRHTAQPRIEVAAQRRGGEWVVSVHDNGAGFEPHQAAELFKPFTRLHAPHFEGSGVGLTIVRRIVERHHGQVSAEGRPGAGATFRFTLPA